MKRVILSLVLAACLIGCSTQSLAEGDEAELPSLKDMLDTLQYIKYVQMPVAIDKALEQTDFEMITNTVWFGIKLYCNSL